MNKKGQVMQNLGALGIGIVSLLIVLVVAFMIMAQSKTVMNDSGYSCAAPAGHTGNEYTFNTTGCCLLGGEDCTTHFNTTGLSTAYNSTNTLTNATATIPGWVGIIVITAIGSLLIGMVMMFRR